MITEKNKKIFAEDADTLISEAMALFKGNRDLAERYSLIAHNILTSHSIKFGRRKLFVCKRCGHLLVPGYTANIRLINGKIKYKCLNCGKTISIVYDKRI